MIPKIVGVTCLLCLSTLGSAQSTITGNVRITAIINGSMFAENSINLIGSISQSSLTGSNTINTTVHSSVSSRGDGGMVSIGSIYNAHGVSGIAINVSVSGVHHTGSGEVVIGGIHSE